MTSLWSTTTVDALFHIGSGKSVTPAARHGEPKYPFLRTSNVLWGRLDLTEVDSMAFSDDEIKSKSLRAGDLLVCEGGDIGRAAIWSGELERCGFQNHLHRLRPRDGDVIPAFYMYYLRLGFTQLGIYGGAGNKTTIPNLSRNRLGALQVPKPPRVVQVEIATALGTIQRAILVSEAKLATNRELFDSLLHQLMTGTRPTESDAISTVLHKVPA